MLDLEGIVTLLDQQKQRATYGAVAGYLGVAQRSLMKGLEKNHRYSWIVNTKTGQPTGYPDDAIHPALVVRSIVIKDAESLASWIGTQ
jgi:hypothetical protein